MIVQGKDIAFNRKQLENKKTKTFYKIKEDKGKN